MRRLAVYLLLALFTLIILCPLLLIGLAAFKTQAELGQALFALPRGLSLQNFATAWRQGHFGRYFLNSCIVVVPVVLAAIGLSILSGYAFSFLPLPGRGFLAALMSLGMIIPLEGLIIPMYYSLRHLGLINTYWSLILPQIGLSLPFGTYLSWTSFRGLPRELIDAAVVDGARRGTILWRILVPLIKPAVNVLIVFFFVWTWNEFLIPLILVTDDALRTLPVGIAFFQGRYTTNLPVLAAGAAIVAAPLIAVYAVFQRSIIQGLTSGAVK